MSEAFGRTEFGLRPIPGETLSFSEPPSGAGHHTGRTARSNPAIIVKQQCDRGFP